MKSRERNQNGIPNKYFKKTVIEELRNKKDTKYTENSEMVEVNPYQQLLRLNSPIERQRLAEWIEKHDLFKCYL